MGLIASILLGTSGVLLAFAIAVVSRLTADDIKAWLPKITDRLIERAVEGLPQGQRDRFAEEWRSHVNDTPGDISKLIVAVGFLHASSAVARSAQPESKKLTVPISQRVVAGLFLVLLAPAMTVIAALIRAEGGPIMFRQSRLDADGNEYQVMKFRTMVFPPESEPRVTRLGRLLRMSDFDRLPLFISVMQGKARLPSFRLAMKEMAQFLRWW